MIPDQIKEMFIMSKQMTTPRRLSAKILKDLSQQVYEAHPTDRFGWMGKELISHIDALEAEIAELKEFREQWELKDGNSPGYNLQKARNYGEQACKYRIECDQLRAENAKLRASLQRICEDCIGCNRKAYEADQALASTSDEALSAIREVIETEKKTNCSCEYHFADRADCPNLSHSEAIKKLKHLFGKP